METHTLEFELDELVQMSHQEQDILDEAIKNKVEEYLEENEFDMVEYGVEKSIIVKITVE